MSWYYMPYISAPDTEGSNSDSTPPEWTFEPLAMSSGTLSPRPSSWRGWKTRGWIGRLSGLTSPVSTAARGLAEWISSLPVSRASRGPLPVSDVALTTTVGSGRTSPGCCVMFDRGSSSWRTCQDSTEVETVEGYRTSWRILPTSGSMRNGVCSPRPTLEHRTSGNDSGSPLWPMATSTDFKRSGGNPQGTGSHGTTLTDRAVRMWGTPVARDDQKSPEAHMAMKQRMKGGPRKQPTSLTVQAKMWPTPRASEGTRGSDGPHGDGGLSLKATVSHHDPTMRSDGPAGVVEADLNPAFVESLMGLPEGWSNPRI